MKALQLAFSRFEKVGNMIKNLDDLKAQGEVDDAAYQQLSSQYAALKVQAKENIQEIRIRVKNEFDKAVKEDRALDTELQNVQLRARVGEIEPEQVDKVMGRFQKRKEALSKKTADLNQALTAQSSAVLGGYVTDVDVNKRVEYKAGFSVPSVGDFQVAEKLEKLRGAAGGLIASETHKQTLQLVAGGLFCLAILILLVKVIGYFRAAQMVGSVEDVAKLFGASARDLQDVGGIPSSGRIYLACFATLAVMAGLGASAFAYFMSKPWANNSALVTCAAGLVVILLIAILGEGVSAGFLVLFLIYGYGVLVSLAT